MKKLLLSAAVGLSLGAGAMGAAQAATDEEALKCGVAVRKTQGQLAAAVGKAQPKLCKSPGDLMDIAAKLSAKFNKKVVSLNGKFSDATCDPDIDVIGGFPLDTGDTADLVFLLTDFLAFGLPLDVLCNNEDDNP